MKECPYTDERRDALENTPPSALEISLRRGFCTPRPSRLPSGNLSGLGVQNPRLWEISWASGGVFSNTSLLSSVYGPNTVQYLYFEGKLSFKLLLRKNGKKEHRKRYDNDWGFSRFGRCISEGVEAKDVFYSLKTMAKLCLGEPIRDHLLVPQERLRSGDERAEELSSEDVVGGDGIHGAAIAQNPGRPCAAVRAKRKASEIMSLCDVYFYGAGARYAGRNWGTTCTPHG